ncbi:hypothetical protein [Cryptosporangium aurantiacum]|uniref:hypothetical protein n=1 Tax=Cryptosporangium aurantiacum TaxID=134849 RepID=UPI00116133DC|nr:hypothetical protein [Cryptosporangium aurantiacum]
MRNSIGAHRQKPAVHKGLDHRDFSPGGAAHADRWRATVEVETSWETAACSIRAALIDAAEVGVRRSGWPRRLAQCDAPATCDSPATWNDPATRDSPATCDSPAAWDYPATWDSPATCDSPATWDSPAAWDAPATGTTRPPVQRARGARSRPRPPRPAALAAGERAEKLHR